jgi:hypothetical protein
MNETSSDPLDRDCKHNMELRDCIRCLRDKIDAAETMRAAAISHAGDTGLYHDAYLWDTIDKYDAAALPAPTGVKP